MPIDNYQKNPDILIPAIVAGAIRGRLILQPGSTVVDNVHGLDILTRTFFCFQDEIAQLSPKRGDADKVYPSMRMTDRTITENAALTCSLTVTYKGLIDEKIPDLVVNGGWSEQSAQLSVTTSAGDPSEGMIVYGAEGQEEPPDKDTLDQNGEVSIVYRAPYSNFMYIQRQQPRGPRYEGRLLLSAADFSIIEMRPARLIGRPLGRIEVRCTSFRVEPVGAYWQCSETQQAVLVPVDVGSYRPRVFAGQGLAVTISGR